MIQRIFFLFLFFPILLQGIYLEDHSFFTVLKYADQDTLVISDIDNTLIESEQHLGSSQWADYLATQFSQAGKNDKDIDQLIVHFGCRVHPFIKMRSVDPETPIVIRQLHEKGISVFSLTARDPVEAEYTHQQLKLADIQMSEFNSMMEFSEEHRDLLFERGVLFCTSHHKKSVVLKSFLERKKQKPKKIIFIDDKWSHVRDVGQYIEQLGIEYIGIRFSRADERVKKFSPEIAKLQYDRLPTFLSDEEAERMINVFMVR